MLADQPKQYLKLGEFSVVERVLLKIAQVSNLNGIIVGIADGDPWWSSQRMPGNVNVTISRGGSERAQTVFNALVDLVQKYSATDNDWVLVHDAVRPCVRVADIDHLVEVCSSAGHGGLLGCTLVDTLKRVDLHGKVLHTEPRQNLWRAMTPQMFRLGELKHALASACSSGNLVTDEAESMELLGASPIMVESDPRNIKITRPADIDLAMQLLGIAKPDSTLNQ